MIHPDLYQEISRLADQLRAKFSPPEFIPGCQVKSVADKSLYATNNGWIEAVCGQHNQQRVRWKSNETVAVDDYIDVLYFPDRRLFEAYGIGGAGAIAAGSGWPFATVRTVSATDADAQYTTIALAITAASDGDVILVDAETISLSTTITIDKSITLTSLGRTVITSSVAGPTIEITDAAGATLENLTIRNTGAGAKSGCVKWAVDDVVIRDCLLEKLSGASTVSYCIWQADGSGHIIDTEAECTDPPGTNYGYLNDTADSSVIFTRGSMAGLTQDVFTARAGSSFGSEFLTTHDISWAGTQSGWAFISGAAVALGGSELNMVNAINEISIDGTFAGNSDLAVPTEKAVKTYVDNYGENIFINGSFDVWQRTTNDTTVSTTRKYVSDMWHVVTGSGTLTNVQRSTTVRSGALSKYSLEMVGTAGVGAVEIGQRIWNDAAAKYKRTVAFSVYIYNGSGAAFTPKLYARTPSAANNWTTNTAQNGGGFGEDLQSCADAAWTKVTWSADISGYTDIDNGFGITIQIPSGSLVASDTVRFAEFNLTPGSTFPPMKLTSFDEQYPLCLPYAYVLDASSNAADQGFGTRVGTTSIAVNFQFPLPMKMAPILAHNISGYTAGAPGTTTIALVNYNTGTFYTITGALTVTLTSPNKTYTAISFVAGTSWSGTTGDIATLRIGPSVVAVFAPSPTVF